MRLRIRRQPTVPIDGFWPAHFRAGLVCNIGTQLASLLLAEGWAEAVSDEGTAGGGAQSQDDIAALVLIVDDESGLRQLTASLLECNGYEVVQASNGKEAIEQLRYHYPDLVVLDLDMPVMNGWQFRVEQQRLPDGWLTTVPILLLTGEDGSDEKVRTLKAVGLVRKPFDATQLLNAIELALHH